MLPNTQLLGRIVPESNNFQDARGFFANGGQKVRSAGSLREGTYAMNLAQFVVITRPTSNYLPLSNPTSARCSSACSPTSTASRASRPS